MPDSFEEKPESIVGSVLGDRYRLERLLGAGATGAVYEASVDGDTRGFAVKIIYAPLLQHEELEARFLREAQIGMELQNRHLVSVHETGHDEAGRLYLVMELIRGYDVAGLLERFGVIEPEVAARIIAQAAEGLAAAHEANVVHRDIKPSNLLVSIDDDDAVTIKVLDFGIAKRPDLYDDQALTRTGASLGSPLYMSPEQVKNPKNVDARTDVWGLGVTLYELLTGTTPHGDVASMAELMIAIATEEPRHVQDLSPWVPNTLARLTHWALKRDLEARCSTARELAEELKSFVGGTYDLSAADLRPLPGEERESRAERYEPTASAEMELDQTVVDSKRRAEDPLIGRRVGQKYKIRTLLGRGGMGNVYEAEQPDHSIVAIKMINPESNREDVLARFVREAKAAASVDNPHVVRIFDAGTDTDLGVPYIVMERLYGLDLATLLKRQGALEPEPTVRLFVQAAKGVAAAHAAGIVHRDIKPANIFISTEHGTGRVTAKVCDFGVAKRLPMEGIEDDSMDLTETGGILGSPLYMSPEQAKSAKRVDFATDVWSLAVSLHHSLSGVRPWDTTESIGELILAICTEDMPKLQTVAPWIPSALADVIRKALIREPEERLSSLEELVALLEPFTGGHVELTRDELRGVDAERRAQRSLPPEIVATGATVDAPASDVTASPVSASTTADGGTRKGAVIAGVVGVTALVGAALYVGLRQPTEPVPAATPEPTATTEESEEVVMHEVDVDVDPPNAEVWIAGSRVEIERGKLRLNGRGGEKFQIELREPGAELGELFVVVVSESGDVVPAQLKLGLGGSEDAGREEESSPTVAKPKPAPRDRPTPETKPASKPKPEPPPAAPAKPPDKIGPIDEW